MHLYVIDVGTDPNTVILKTNAKIIKLKSVELHELVKACQRRDRLAQKQLFEQYAPLFLSICYRYMKQREEAEDAMISAFHTILTKIDSYNRDGSFEGWMKRIVINTCLMSIRKNRLSFSDLEEVAHVRVDQASPIQELYEKDVLSLLDYLPDGYRTIFNLYAIEGYKHREIAEMLDISINTSKSQLIQARKRLSELIESQEKSQQL